MKKKPKPKAKKMTLVFEVVARDSGTLLFSREVKFKITAAELASPAFIATLLRYGDDLLEGCIKTSWRPVLMRRKAVKCGSCNLSRTGKHKSFCPADPDQAYAFKPRTET